MESEKRAKRPRIGVSNREGMTERYEKVEYKRGGEEGLTSYGANTERPHYSRNNYGEGGNRSYTNDRPNNYGNRQGGYGQNRQGGYNQNRQGGYGNNRYNQNRPQQRRNKNYNSRPQRIEYELPEVDPNEPIRLNKYMANAGICSRREADEYIQAGEVLVNGEPVTELGTKITRNDTVTFRGKVVTLERKIYVLLNKPKDCVTTSDDPQGRTCRPQAHRPGRHVSIDGGVNAVGRKIVAS